MHKKVLSLAALMAACLLATAAPAAEKTKDDRTVKDGMMVSVEYTLKGTDGKVIETSKGQRADQVYPRQEDDDPRARKGTHRHESRRRKTGNRQTRGRLRAG